MNSLIIKIISHLKQNQPANNKKKKVFYYSTFNANMLEFLEFKLP